MRGKDLATAAADAGVPVAGLLRDAHRDVQLAGQRVLAAYEMREGLMIGIFEDNGLMTIYISTVSGLGDQVRSDLSDAVRAALSPYTSLVPFINVVFLNREMD